MITRYDATTRAEQDRFAYWHEVICRLFPRAASRRGDELPFTANLEQRGLGAIAISDIRCNAVRYQRARHDQRLDAKEEFLVSLMLEGDARLDQGGRSTVQRPGALVLYDAAQPFDYAFSKAYRILLTTIPRQSLMSRLPGAERQTAIALPTFNPLGQLASDLMTGATHLEPSTRDSVAGRVGITLVEVVCAAFEQHLSLDDQGHDRQAALVKRAKDYVRSRIDDPEMDVESIAAAMHVSARTLSRAFAGESETVIRWLWSERLRRGHALLTEGRIAHVSDAALGCGFSNSSHFARMFKQTYGITPHALLQRQADTFVQDGV